MRIFIAGGTGFIGQALIRNLIQEGHSVTALARNPDKLGVLSSHIRPVVGSPLIAGPWQQEMASHEIIINLTGSSIFTRWTPAAKKMIMHSRVASTKNIVQAIPAQSASPITLINASASGYYGFCRDEEKYEVDLPGSDFLASVCQAWENEALQAQGKARVVLLRTGVVLGKNGGALATMLPAFRLGIGGKLGHGQQWFPWIHLNDLTNAIIFLMNHKEIHGPVNLSAPKPVRNKDFTRYLGQTLHRPTFMSVPKFAVRLALGELSSVVLEGCRMMPGVLLENGFTFRFHEVQSAIEDIVGKVTR
ncbi:MAG: TIGR01777 family protein [Desulfurivibrio sp.]|nr:TIGR01777 family protein [Desulfurivibrio sp.]MBU3937023.1 TIGR01777 family oxidoreductase [Pseudomonadota bacterium]